MVDLVLPPALMQATTSFRYIDQTGFTRGANNGAVQTVNYGGDRVGASIGFTQAGGASSTEKSRRRQLQTFLMALRGRVNRAWLIDSSYTPGGSFPAPELFVNSDFSNGTTSWTAGHTMSVSDAVMRLTHTGVFATSPQIYQNSMTFVQYAPYALRSLLVAGKGFASSMGPRIDTAATQLAATLASTRGYSIASGVMRDTTGVGYILLSDSAGSLAGDYVQAPFTSFARCALTDSGGNLFTQSKAIDHADWTRANLTAVTANATAGPDNASDADLVVPNASVASHYVTQSKTISSSATEMLVDGYFKAGGYNFVRLQMRESTGSTDLNQVFNLGTGALGATANTGANWGNRRAVIRDIGNGWYYCALIGRKTSAGITCDAYIVVESVDGLANYAGNTTSGVYYSNLTMTPSSSFARPVTTTTAAVAASTQNGLALYLKGLPASTAGLLLAGDWVEIDGQLKMVTASLDSDAAGLGYLQFAPPLRRAVADNTPVIVTKPMGRFIATDSLGWDNEPGVFSHAAIELEEAYS